MSPPAGEPSDAHLAGLARAGDRAALDALVRRHTGLVRSVVAAAHAPPEVDADDLTQEGLIALARAALKWAAGKRVGGRRSKFSTYAFPAVRNAVLDELVRQRDHPRACDPTEQPRDDSDRFCLSQVPAPEDGPDDNPAGLLADLLGRLSPLHRLCVELEYGLSREVTDGRPRPKDNRRKESRRRAEIYRRTGLNWSQFRRVLAEAIDVMRKDQP